MDLTKAGAENVLQLKTVVIASIKTLPDYLNKSVLHEKYVIQGLSAKQIARKFGVSKSTVLSALRSAEIPLRASHQPHGRYAKPPYGKKVSRGRLANCTYEQKVIRLVARLSKQGLSTRVITRKLAEMKLKNRNGQFRWHHELIRSILKRLFVDSSKNG